MKKLLMIASIFVFGLLYQSANAQVKFSVHVNLGQQPVWGPVGYDYAEYYYLPDIDSYYDINRQQFIYYSGSRWVFVNRLPSRYGNYDLYNSYKVVVNEPRPYLHADVYRNKYRQAPHERQVIIRDSREEKYYAVKGHPKHNEWVRKHGNGRDRDRGGRGRDDRH